MATIKVVAIRPGYYGEVYREPGDIFFMEEDVYKPKQPNGQPYSNRRGDGPLVSSWCKPVTPEALAEVEPEVKLEPGNRPPAAGPERGTREDIGASANGAAAPVVVPAPSPVAPAPALASPPAVVPAAPAAVLPPAPVAGSVIAKDPLDLL